MPAGVRRGLLKHRHTAPNPEILGTPWLEILVLQESGRLDPPSRPHGLGFRVPYKIFIRAATSIKTQTGTPKQQMRLASYIRSV